MKIIITLVVIAVIVGGAALIFLGSNSDDRNSSSELQEDSGNLIVSSSPAPSPELNGTGPSNGVEGLTQSVTALDDGSQFAQGPFVAANDALSNSGISSDQKHVFGLPDGTIAVLYHRVSSVSELQEIVAIHSHDGGQTWHGEIVIGNESADATYSGVLAPNGDIFVAYGRNANGEAGGAIKLARLIYEPLEFGWVLGNEERIVWDWHGFGAGSPVLTFTGERLWLGYRYFEQTGYSIYVQYANPDAQGDYPFANWSVMTPLTAPVENPELVVSLVSHGTQLSAFYNVGKFGVDWRRVLDPIGNPENWLSSQSPMPILAELYNEDEHRIKLSVTSDFNGNIHLAVSLEGLVIGHSMYDGFEWSRFRQLASNNVSNPSAASDGVNTWIFWNKLDSSGINVIQKKQWTHEDGWERGSTSPWTQERDESPPSVFVYRSRNEDFSDISRFVATQGQFNGNGGLAIVQYLQRAGDMLIIGRTERFDFLPLNAQATNMTEFAQALEYWNGSDWADLPLNSIQSLGAINGVIGSNGPVNFTPPSDWELTDVNGVNGFYVRLVWDGVFASLASLRFTSFAEIGKPMIGVVQPNIVGSVWTDSAPASINRKLWFGSQSTDASSLLSSAKPVHSHRKMIATSVDQDGRPISLPAGSQRQYFQASIDIGDTIRFQLLDGQERSLTLLATNREFSTRNDVTVWSTATVEVSGPGIHAQRASIPAAYFQSSVVLNDVRIYVEITKEFNDFRLSGGGTSSDARLMLSDARYSLTSLYDYNYPFGGILWGLGPFDSYYQGLLGTPDGHSHGEAFRQSLPSETSVQAWRRSSLNLALRGNAWTASLEETADGRTTEWHQVSSLTNVRLDVAGGLVKSGTVIGEVAESDKPTVQWGANSNYDWTPLLAEWYVGQSSPEIRSYQKDWLVIGPFSSEGILEPLAEEFLGDEAGVNPSDGDLGTQGLRWKRYDGIVPGVVNVAEAVSPYPYSGWANINGNMPFSVAYFATYIHSPSSRNATLNVGSSDAFRIWVNDEMVFENLAMVRVRRPSDWSILPDGFKVEVELNKGWNRILLKLSQGDTEFFGPESAQRAWQLTFRVTDQFGGLIDSLKTNPDMDIFYDPLKKFAIPIADSGIHQFALTRPPARGHEWPEKADLLVGESFTYSLLDGSQRTIKLLSYEEILPRHKVEATVEVSGNGKNETHTLEVAPGGVPVSINGLRVYGYAWKEAGDFGFEQVGATGDFPLTTGKDVGFALSDASVTMFPDIQNYTYPFDIPLHGGDDLQTWLEPAGDFDSNAWAHAGYDIHAPRDSHLVAIHDGVIWYNKPSNNDPQTIGQGMAWLAIGNGKRFDDPETWMFTHVLTGNALVPSGTFVEKGTLIANGGSHVGSKDSFDFGSWLFFNEVWNFEHKDDFPTPRYWLALGPFDGTMSSNYVAPSERGNISESIQPREGEFNSQTRKRWTFGDNFGNGVVALNELTSAAPFAGYPDRWPTNSVAYAATYIFSPEDYTTDQQVYINWGANQPTKVWLNGLTVIEDPTRGNEVIQIDQMRNVLPLKKGWNTLIVKASTSSSNGLIRFSPKIGDIKGNRIPGIEFSTRNLNLRASTLESNIIDIEWSSPDYHGTFVESYLIDVATDPGFQNLVINNLDVGRVNTYKIEGLNGNAQYFIRVKPFNAEMTGSVYWQHVDSIDVAIGLGGAVPVNPFEVPSGPSEVPIGSEGGFPDDAFFVNFNIDAGEEVYPFSSKIRGVATNNWNWLENGLMEPLQKRHSIVQATSYLRPGIIRFAGGLWANNVGWDREGIAPKDGDWIFTDPDTSDVFHYTHAYSREMVDSFADFASQLGSEAIIQVNICDNNLSMWTDLVQYTNIESHYGFKYWELGNEQSLDSCGLNPQSYAKRFVVYQESLKAVDPSIKILGPVTHNPAEIVWMDAVVDAVGEELDVATWHWYQLSEWTQNRSSFTYQGGSLEALLAHDGPVGVGCFDGFGCTDRGGSIEDGRLSLWMNRRGVAEQMMETVNKRYRSSIPGLETAITEFGVHAADHQLPINSNHMAAIWLADVLPRWAYNGLDIATYYSLEDGSVNGENSRGLLGIWDDEGTGIIDVRPIYYTMFMFSQYFGDTLVESSTNDESQKTVVWASTDSTDDGTLKLMLVNMHDTPAVANININNFDPQVGYAFTLDSTDPLSMENPISYTRHNSNINGVRIQDYNINNPMPFDKSIADIKAVEVEVSGRFIYTLPPYSAVSLVLRDSDGPAPKASPAILQ